MGGGPIPWYPTKDDAEEAKQIGFGYGSGSEGFLNDENARVTGTSNYQFDSRGRKIMRFQPVSYDPQFRSAAALSNLGSSDAGSQNIELRLASIDPQMRDNLKDVYMRAALAANRSPITALGFDPKRAAVDALMPSRSYGAAEIAGSYTPTTDSIYFNLSTPEPSAIVHESTHRGLEQLYQNHPQMMKYLAEKFPIGQHTSAEEMIVRELMRTVAGDPEKWSGVESDRQRADAMQYFQQNPQAANALQRMQELAQMDIKNRSQGHAH